jgi:hypothetical protein
VVRDGTVDAHDPLPEQPGVNVEAALPQSPLLEDDGDRERKRPAGRRMIWRLPLLP